MVSLNICADSTEPPLLDTAISNYICFNYLLFEIAKVWWFKMVLRVRCISETNAIKTNPMYTLYRSQPDAAAFCCCRGHFCGHFTELCPRMYLPNYVNRSSVLLCIILECSRKANKTGKNTTHTLYPGCNIFLHRRSETSSHVSYLFGRTLCWKLCHFSKKNSSKSLVSR